MELVKFFPVILKTYGFHNPAYFLVCDNIHLPIQHAHTYVHVCTAGGGCMCVVAEVENVSVLGYAHEENFKEK